MIIARRLFLYSLLVIAFLLAMSVFTSTWAQQGQPMGTATSNVYSKGMLSADSALRAAKLFKVYPYFDSTGELAVVGHKFYWHNGIVWVNGVDSATSTLALKDSMIVVRDSLALVVKYRDSLNNVYETPTQAVVTFFKRIDSNTHKNAITLDYFNTNLPVFVTPTTTLTGDVTGVGVYTVNTTLASVGTAGTPGSATQSPVITFDGKGREIAWSNVTITPAFSSITGTPTTLGGYGITDAYTKTVSDTRYLLTSDTGASGNKVSYTQWDLKTAGNATVALGNISPAPTTGTVTSVGTGFGLSGGTITSTGTLYIDSTIIPIWNDTISARRRLATPAYINSLGYGSGTVTSITAGTGLSGGTITTTGTISLPNVGTAGTYGSATIVPIITTDAQGRSSITTTIITPAFSSITGKPTTAAGYGITDVYTKTVSDTRYLLTSDTGASGNKISYTQWDLKTAGNATVALGNISPAPATGTMTGITINGSSTGIVVSGGTPATAPTYTVSIGASVTTASVTVNGTTISTTNEPSATFLGGSGGGFRLGGFRSGIPTDGAIWSADVTPSATNYVLVANSGSTLLNGAFVDLQVATTRYIGLNVGGNGKINIQKDEVLLAGTTLDYAITGGAATAGTATLVGGTKTISTTAIKAGDIVIVSGNTPGINASAYFAPAASIVAATSFVINAITPGGVTLNILDVSTVNWLIIHTH